MDYADYKGLYIPNLLIILISDVFYVFETFV
jgi:hypothetical protein